MDKLLLSLSLIASVLTSMTVNSAPMQTSKLISSIDPLQKRYNYFMNEDGSTAASPAVATADESDGATQNAKDTNANFDDNGLKKDGDDVDVGAKMTPNTRSRQNKMIGFYPYTAAVNPYPFGYPYISPVYYPPEFYDDFAAFFDGYGGEEEEIMSRQNPGNRRRVAYKNSPIYYIRLPAQPYMFIPGLGYVSQPPTYHPMTLPPPPPPQPQPSPFYNLPLDFISNGKPTNIYQWGSPAGLGYMPQQPPPQYGNYPSAPAQTYPSRPQRPYAHRPSAAMNPYIQDSKVTSLKGQFLFNGRPEDIFILPNTYSSIYSDPRYGNSYY